MATHLGKKLGAGSDYAESWEVCDHGEDQSVVATGPLAGRTLGAITREHTRELLGVDVSPPRFPLLFKFLDAQARLSVQVHPNDEQARKWDPRELGKTEAWYVLAADPGAMIYCGLKRGVDRAVLKRALAQGRCEECLHAVEPRQGDCFFLPAGTVHALGGGLLIAEIQQSSDLTFRLFDWNRRGADGLPRPLHIEQALEVIDFARGPVDPQAAAATGRPGMRRLVECEKFTWDEWDFAQPTTLGGDGRCHLLAVIKGEVGIEGDPAGRPLARGETALLPAACGATTLTPLPSVTLLDASTPEPATA